MISVVSALTDLCNEWSEKIVDYILMARWSCNLLYSGLNGPFHYDSAVSQSPQWKLSLHLEL